jgi:hypothetical protein
MKNFLPGSCIIVRFGAIAKVRAIGGVAISSAFGRHLLLVAAVTVVVGVGIAFHVLNKYLKNISTN